MNFKKTNFALVIGSVGLINAMSASAAAVNTGDILSISSGVNAYDSNGNFIGVSSGSWFAMDANDNFKISSTEKIILDEGNTGLIIGTITPAGASHAGNILPGDTNVITAPWQFFGNTGSDYVTVAVTGDTTTGLNMSGWTVTWNGIPAIPMNSGAWTPAAAISGMAAGPYTNGMGKLSWNGVYGATYTLDYLATVPLSDPSGFGGVKYALHLEGTVQAVPEASAYGMMLAGLGLVGIAARHRKQSEG